MGDNSIGNDFRCADRRWLRSRRFSLRLVALLILSAIASSNFAQEEYTQGDDDAWTRFANGSWKSLRIYKETFKADGSVETTSTQEVRMTLERVDETRYTLKYEVVVEAGGKRFEAEPQYVKHGFYGETNGQKATVRDIGARDLMVSGRRIATQLQEITVNGTDLRRVAQIHYTPDVPPYILRQEIVATDSEGRVKNYEAESEVIALEMPYKILSQIKPAAFVHTVQTMTTGETTTTVEVFCSEVPGGVVAHSAKSLDQTGRLVQRTTLELLDYEGLVKPPTEPVAGRRRLFLRARRR